MKELPIFQPKGGPPQNPLPNPEIYTKMGEHGIFKMLEAFYLSLAQSKIRELFPAEDPAQMMEASKRSAAFFVGVCGGPPLYQERFGPPMMRKRHMAFEIDETGRQEWLRCFKETLVDADQKFGFPLEHLPGFLTWLEGFSGWMVNRE